MLPGSAVWMTERIFGLSIPMPKAMVATMTSSFPARNASCTRRAALRIEAGMIRRGAEIAGEQRGHALRLLAAGRIDDGRPTRGIGQQLAAPDRGAATGSISTTSMAIFDRGGSHG